MNRLFKMGRKKDDVKPVSEDPEEEIHRADADQSEEEMSKSNDSHQLCTAEEETCDTSAGSPAENPKLVVVEEIKIADSSSTSEGAKEISNGSFLDPSTITAVSSTLVLVLLAWNLFFRRKQRRQRRMWKRDSQKILTRVEDVVLQLEERDEEIDILEQQLKTEQEQAAKEKEKITKQFQQALEAKEEEFKARITELQRQQREADGRLEKAAAEIQRYVEAEQDHKIELLEKNLLASQLSTALADREAQIEELQQTNRAQSDKIHELQQRIKADAIKAEKIISDLTSERDDRFQILQQENDAIKTTVMGMLKQTQERFDADKIQMKKEMSQRDDKIRSLQEELWQSNALLKRLQEDKGVQATLSKSVRNLLDDMKESEDGKDSDETNRNGEGEPK